LFLDFLEVLLEILLLLCNFFLAGCGLIIGEAELINLGFDTIDLLN